MEEKMEDPDELRKTLDKSEETKDRVKVESTGASKRKMSGSRDEEHERGRKRMKSSAEEHVRDPGLKRHRTEEDEEQRDSKRTRLSSFRKLSLQTGRKSNVKDQQSRGQKRSREPDDDKEPERKKSAKTSSSGNRPALDKQKIDVMDQQSRGQKRSREPDDNNEPECQKLAKTSSGKRPTLDEQKIDVKDHSGRGQKRSREPDDNNEPERQKLAKTSSSGNRSPQDEQKIAQTPSPRKPAQKRSRENEEEEERNTLKKARISSTNQGNNVAGGSGQIVDDSKTSHRPSLTDYTFQKALGQGSYGAVKLALQSSTDQLVAIKIIRKASLPEKFIQMEQRILQTAQGSPFLCHGLATFHTPENSFLVMEYVSGGTLNSFMAEKGSLHITESRFIAAELFCGIQFLHSHGIIHRDLKPENILLDHEGHAKIADFGLAAENIFGTKRVYGRYGTLHYMAPEVLSDKSYGKSADWWSYGVILFCMITRQHPFNFWLPEAVYRIQVLFGSPSYPDWLDGDPLDLLNKLLDKNPDSRLGVTGRITEHDFFKDIDWEEVGSGKLRPPFQMAARRI